MLTWLGGPHLVFMSLGNERKEWTRFYALFVERCGNSGPSQVFHAAARRAPAHPNGPSGRRPVRPRRTNPERPATWCAADQQ